MPYAVEMGSFDRGPQTKPLSLERALETIAALTLREEVYARELARAHTSLADAQLLGRTGTWTWDLATNVVHLSAGQYRLFGEESGTSVSYERYLGYLSAAERARTTAAIEVTLRGGGDYVIEHEITRADGVVRIFAERVRRARLR